MLNALYNFLGIKDCKPDENNFGKNDIGNPFFVIFLTILFFIISQLIALGIVEIAQKFVLDQTPTQSVLLYSSFAQFIFILIAEIVAIGLVLWTVCKRKVAFADIGLGRMPKWGDLKKGSIIFIYFFAGLIITNILLSNFFPGFDDSKQDVGFNTLNGFNDRFFAFVSLVILPPIGEEILMRGFLYGALRKRMRLFWAGFITCVIFGFAHIIDGSGGGLLWSAAWTTFMLSAWLVYLRERTGALYAGILVHALNNLIAFGVHFHS